MTKRFNLVLEDDLYDDWTRFYGAYGLRQTILRRVVWILVNRARIKAGGSPPILWSPEYENMTLDQIVNEITDEVTKYGND